MINETSIIEVKFSRKHFLRSACRSCGPKGPRLHLKLPAELANVYGHVALALVAWKLQDWRCHSELLTGRGHW